MKIGLRGRGTNSGEGTGSGEGAVGSGVRGGRVAKRQLLKLLATGAGVLGAAGLGQVVAPARRAEATYTPGPSVDTVDHDLQVNGNLTVPLGRLGIGISGTPNTTLQARGPSGDLARLESSSGSEATLVFAPNDGPLAAARIRGVAVASMAELALLTGGVERVRVDRSGNVGIGTTTPGADFTVAAGDFPSTTGVLHLKRAATYEGAAVVVEGYDEASLWLGTTSGAANTRVFQLRLANGVTEFRSRGDNLLGGDVGVALAHGTGKVGIGTSSPVEQLDVLGNARVSEAFFAGSRKVADGAGTYYA